MKPYSSFRSGRDGTRLPRFTAGALLLIVAPLMSAIADDDPMKDGSYRTKGRVASGELADYERGEIDWDVLLADYREYELPLPGDRAKLLRFPREIWESEGPMRVWHLGFPLPPEKTEAGEIPRVLVGAEVFAFRENSFRAIDRELPDGTIEKAEQFKAEPLTGPWDGKNLERFEFIFHGQDRSALDTNALIATAIQLRHLSAPEATHLMEESLRFDADHYVAWVSGFTQPAGWTARQILAESAWRAWINRWHRGEESSARSKAVLARILPRLPASRQGAARAILGEIDPSLLDASKATALKDTLAEALLYYGVFGGEWQPLVEHARRDPDAFDILLPLLDDDRLLPKAIPDDVCKRPTPARREVRVWYPRDRFLRVCDVAAVLLDEACGRALLGCDTQATRERLQALAARARFWREASRQPDAGASIRAQWFRVDADGTRRLNLPALELQSVSDFPTLLEALPEELGTVTAEGLPELSSLILMADYFHARWNPGDRKASKEERLKLIHRPDAALARLYDAASRSGNSPEVRAILLRNALASPSDYDRGEGGESLETIALEWIARPLTPGEGTLVAEIPTRSPASDLWEALLTATMRAHPAQAITMIGRAAGEKAYSDHQSRREQLRYCWGLLDDERQRDASAAPTPEPDGVAFGTEFPTLRVGDFAALQLGRKLELPWNPSPEWGDAEWNQFQSRVREAFLRLDSQMWRGILPREDE